MLTYSLEKQPHAPLYLQLYLNIREEIRRGVLPAGTKLPSKRALAEHLCLSKSTVENAYAQLIAEGYVISEEKRGYYVAQVAVVPAADVPVHRQQTQQRTYELDLCSNSVDPNRFPFSVWSSLMRDVVLTYRRELLSPLPNQGALCLREAICDYLAQNRGMRVEPGQVVIGAGTEYLYGMILQLLGTDLRYALEDPSYSKIPRVYSAHGVTCRFLPMDAEGVRMDALDATDVQVLHISPAHHFPTGTVTTQKRRMELLAWAAEKDDRYIIEDEYDSEFRLIGKPIPPMQTADGAESVIYINTFSKTIAPSVRISYLILPPHLAQRWQTKLGFYACTVPAFEQYTLAAFIREGHFERHINRMKRYYRELRNAVIDEIERSALAPYLTILEQTAGLHFSVRMQTAISDAEITALCESCGIRVACLSSYYNDPKEAPPHLALVNYSGISPQQLRQALEKLAEKFGVH